MENKYSGEERRRFQRVNVSFIVVYKVNQPVQVSMMLGNKEVHAIMSNLSINGMSILTNYNLPAATIISSKFILLNEKAPKIMDRVKAIEVKGEVRYSRFIKELAYQLGIHFTDITDSDRSFIGEFIKRAEETR
ncbi:MAG: PilZ domain-containing protein [Candidatus Omnitrophica bacterium]|nr:PilZ domain-containing protein [Candidatus Omnitrophota bacterium]